MLPAIITIAIILAVAVTGIAAAVAYEKKRKAEIAAVAESLGLAWVPEDDATIRDRFSSLALFNLGRGRKMANCMTGDSGEVRISIFDYQWTTGSGKHQHTAQVTLVALESPRLRLAPFSIRPENMFDAIGGMLGFQDIDFDDDAAFSNSYVLKSPDEPAVRKLFAPPLRQYFASNPGSNAEGAGPILVLQHRRAKPADYPNLLKQAYEVFGLIVDKGEMAATPPEAAPSE
jgi:hypothetical protein